MRRGSMPKPAATIFPTWLSVVWPGMDTRHGQIRPKRMPGTYQASEREPSRDWGCESGRRYFRAGFPRWGRGDVGWIVRLVGVGAEREGLCQISRHFQAAIPNMASINGRNHDISHCQGILVRS